MGQQQLLLIVLGVIIVGIAIAVGISMFKSNAVSSNRDQVINDLNNLAAKAQQYFRKPTSMAGGGEGFGQFHLDSIDVNNANGYYSYNITAAPTAAALTLAVGDTTSLAGVTGTGGPQAFYILGQGTEMGNDGTHHVGAYALVTQNGPAVTVIN
ncbi:MAG: hypothetical protein WAO19_10835 [Candidatus Kryptoniota bacterium]